MVTILNTVVGQAFHLFPFHNNRINSREYQWNLWTVIFVITLGFFI